MALVEEFDSPLDLDNASQTDQGVSDIAGTLLGVLILGLYEGTLNPIPYTLNPKVQVLGDVWVQVVARWEKQRVVIWVAIVVASDSDLQIALPRSHVSVI